MALQAGDEAPVFEAMSDQNQKIRLSDFRGKKVVLYFYPADDTPGCTLQSCGFRDHHFEAQNLNAIILGVSPDGVASHEHFRAKYSLPFTLLVDDKHLIAQAYGVWQEQSWFGLRPGHIVRSHFIIDEHGRIVAAEYKVPAWHSVARAMQTLRES